MNEGRNEPNRWRVQAFLYKDITGTDEDIPYQPAYFRTRTMAEAYLRKLRKGFAGQAYCVMVRELAVASLHPEGDWPPSDQRTHQ